MLHIYAHRVVSSGLLVEHVVFFGNYIYLTVIHTRMIFCCLTTQGPQGKTRKSSSIFLCNQGHGDTNKAYLVFKPAIAVKSYTTVHEVHPELYKYPHYTYVPGIPGICGYIDFGVNREIQIDKR